MRGRTNERIRKERARGKNEKKNPLKRKIEGKMRED